MHRDFAFTSLANTGHYPDYFQPGFPTDLAAPHVDAVTDAFGGTLLDCNVSLNEHDCRQGPYQVRRTWDSLAKSGVQPKEVTVRLYDGSCNKCVLKWLPVDPKYLRKLNVSTFAEKRHQRRRVTEEALKVLCAVIPKNRVCADLKDVKLNSFAVDAFVTYLPLIDDSVRVGLRRLSLSNVRFDNGVLPVQLFAHFTALGFVSLQNIDIDW